MRFRFSIDFMFLLALLMALVILFGLVTDHFWSASTFRTIANRIPALALVALGMTFVLVAGGIDLSVGSIAGLSGAIFGVLAVESGFAPGPAVAIAILSAAACGLGNGILSGMLGVPSFIVTLGALEALRGLAYLATESQTKYLGQTLSSWQDPIAGIGTSPAFLAVVVLTVLAHLVLTRTVFGRRVVAVGTNDEAARLAGMSPKKVRIWVFALSGGLAGFAGLTQVARFGAADPNAGSGLELAAIAAAVIGGTSLMGGRGSMLCTFIGVLIIATLEAGLAHVGATEPIKRVVTGTVIIAAVAAEALRLRMMSSLSSPALS